MAFSWEYILLIFAAFNLCGVYSQTTSCTYISNNTFECDYTNVNSAPIWTSASGFANSAFWFGQNPQSVLITNVGGTLFPTSLWSTFSQYNGSPLNINTVTTAITIQCTSAFTIPSNAFSGLDSHPTLNIEYCELTLNANAFANSNFTYLNIRYGKIASIDPSAFAMTMNTAGYITIERAPVVGNKFPDGLFAQATNLKYLSLTHLDLTTFTQSVITGTTDVKTLDLTGNPITYLLDGTFDGLISLWYINMNYFHWKCDCQSVWMFYWADVNRVQLDGDFLCYSPNEYINQRLYSYNQTVCAETPTIDPLEAVIGVALFFALILAVAALVMSLTLKAHLNHRRQMVDAKAKNIIIWREQEEHTIEFDKDGNVKAVDGETRGADENAPEEKGADDKTPNGDANPESKEPEAEPAKGKEEPSKEPEKAENPPPENLGHKDSSSRPGTSTGRTENHPHMPKDPDADNDSGKVTAVDS